MPDEEDDYEETSEEGNLREGSEQRNNTDDWK
jgi:hypothetical protein